MKVIKKLFFLVFTILLFPLYQSLYAQGTITIDHKIQRFIDNVSGLDRTKYTNVHFFLENNQEFNSFKSTYNINSNYVGSRQFYNPFVTVRNGVIPPVRNVYSGVRDVTRIVATGKDDQLFFNNNLDYSQENISAYSLRAARYVAESYKKEWDRVPEFIEPLNEPMVHAVNHYPEGRETPRRYVRAKTDAVITKICEYHRDLGRSIHATPELSKMKVMGFASAFPEFESNDFRHWNSNYKKFMDIAGRDVDVFSLHLYDGRGVNNSGGRRSGSNSEAILDMVETYSNIKFGRVKPIAITEYGRLVSDQPGFPGVSNYNPVENSQAVRSQIHMVMNFMERANDIELAIPFTVYGPDTSKKFSKSSILTRNSAGNIVLTPRKFFYEMLKDLRGRRVQINSTNIDVQTQAFVDGKKLYVVLNNLNDNRQTVNLNLMNTNGLQNVAIKRLRVLINGQPQLTRTVQNTAPRSLSLQYGETVVLTYNFNNNITFGNKIYSKKYYSSQYLKPIRANTNNSFSFNNVNGGGTGFATVRLSVGRNLGASLRPTIQVNGNNVSISGDIIRGYNQNSRRRFFGTLEIPVPMRFINSGNNTVKVKFSDNGGHISSVILQVQKHQTPVTGGGNNNPERFFIVNRQTGGKIRPRTGTDGAFIVQTPANYVNNWVRWEKVNTSNGYFYLKNVETGKYFRPVNGDDNSRLELRPTSYSGNFTQWKQVLSSGGYFYLQNRATGKYFRPSSADDIGPSTGTDFDMVQKPTSYSGRWTQWKFVNVNTASSQLTIDTKNILEDVKQTATLKVYPNPIITDDILHILLSDLDGKAQISLIDMHGRSVKSKVSHEEQTTINVEGLSGVFIVKVATQNKTFTEKVIIQ